MLTARDIARRSNGQTQVRTSPLRGRMRFASLTTSDDHVVDIAFACGVSGLESDVEQRMLVEAFLSDREAVSVDDVATHFTPPLRDAIARAVAKRPAEYWLDESSRGELVDALRKAAKPVAFNCGVELMPPFELTVESPSLQREKLESMQRKLAERRAAGQAEHVHRAAELLKQFHTLRDAAPGMSPGQLLDQVSPADRGSMLETLLLASGSGAEAKSLWAVAGSTLVKIDPRADAPKTQVVEFSTTLGPLRSVQSAGNSLLIGAQAGVIVHEPHAEYVDRGVTSPMGFNAVVSTGDTIFATHGEAGLVAWRVSEQEPAFTIRPDPGQRFANATVLDEQRVLYSAGASVFIANVGGTIMPMAVGNDTVVFIAVENDRVIVVRNNGLVELFDRGTFERTSSTQRCGEVTSAALLPWLGTTRLLLATADGPVCCVGTDDALVTQYASPHRGLRAITAAADLIAGISPDRQRLVLWKSWDGRKPAAEVHLANVARHRAADVCFA